MSELPESENEDVLSGTARIEKSQPVSFAPVLETEIVELLEVLRYDERRDAVFEAFLEENQTADAPVAVLERMDLFEADMEVKQILERLVGISPPSEQLRHFAVDVLCGTSLHVADDVVEPFVFAHREPVLATVGRAALQDSVKSLDICFRQSGGSGHDDHVRRAEVVRRFHDVVHGNIGGQGADGFRLEYPACLLVGEAAALDVVRVVGKVDLKPMVETSRNHRTPFCFQNAENRRGESPPAFALRLCGIRRYPPFPMVKRRAWYTALGAIGADLARCDSPLFGGFINRCEMHLMVSLRKFIYPEKEVYLP